MKEHSTYTYLSLIGVNLIYASVSIFTKWASLQPLLSWQYIACIVGAIIVMGVYAICWQQVLKSIELSTAYMFKGTSLVFIMLLAWLLFGEQLTLNNVIGACVIITGIALYAKE